MQANSKNGGTYTSFVISMENREIIDEIEFELPDGILGKLFEGYAYKQLHNIFEYRKIATVRELEKTDIY